MKKLEKSLENTHVKYEHQNEQVKYLKDTAESVSEQCENLQQENYFLKVGTLLLNKN